MTIRADVWKPSDYGSGWKCEKRGEISVDSENKVLYIEIEGEKFGLDIEDARRIFNFFIS